MPIIIVFTLEVCIVFFFYVFWIFFVLEYIFKFPSISFLSTQQCLLDKEWSHYPHLSFYISSLSSPSISNALYRTLLWVFINPSSTSSTPSSTLGSLLSRAHSCLSEAPNPVSLEGVDTYTEDVRDQVSAHGFLPSCRQPSCQPI